VHTNLEIEGVIRVTDKGGRVVLSMNVGNQPLLMLISAPLSNRSCTVEVCPFLKL